MKRLIILLLVLCTLCLPALADTVRVVDDANLLSSWEETLLQEKIDAIRDTYRMDVAIVTKDGIGFRSINVYAADYFEANDYGMGLNKDGLIFLMDMGEREYFTATHGKAVTVFTDYGLDTIHDKVVGHLSSGDYFMAFSRYLSYVEQYLEDYRRDGTIHDRYGYHATSTPQTVQERFAEMVPIILIGAFVIALIVTFCLKNQLKSVRRKQNASSYIQQGSFYLSRSQDIYLYTRTTRRKIETNTGSGGRGGSSTFRSSSGSSFGGRGGRF